MTYRPQFEPAPTPEGFTDEDFEYVFNPETNPVLGTVLMIGQELLSIPLQLQADAFFIIREIQVGTPQSALGVRFRDAFGNYLSEPNAFIPSWCYASTAGNNGMVMEPELPCPRGAVIMMDLANVATI